MFINDFQNNHLTHFSIQQLEQARNNQTEETKELSMNKDKFNQLSGVQQNADFKRQLTKFRIEDAALYLKENNMPVTAMAIVNATGLSKATVYRYRELIGNENLRNYTKFQNTFAPQIKPLDTTSTTQISS
jgi:response regulator of citrate/malate metabolism